MGQPRRVAIFDYSDPFIARMGPLVVISVIGGLMLLVSAVLLIVVLVRSQFRSERQLATPLRYALAVNPPKRVPASLNGFALWNSIVLVLMLAAYGYPIGQFLALKSSVPAYEVTRQSVSPGGP
jgi:cytochrome c oxidase subunit 1